MYDIDQVHTTPRKFENATISAYFRFVFEETPEKPIDNRDIILSKNLCSQIVPVHTKN